MILERIGAFEEDCAFLAHRHFLAVIIADMDCTEYGASDRAAMRHPVGAADHGHAIAFAARIIFEDNRPPPVDHRFLDVRRARRRRMDGMLVRRQIIFAAHIFGQFEHPHKMGRDPLAVGNAVFLDCRERAFGIEFLHHHHSPAEPMDGGRPAQRRCVVERRRREIDAATIAFDLEPHSRKPHQRRGRFDSWIFRRGGQNTLRATGRSGAVEHHAANALVGNRIDRHSRQNFLTATAECQCRQVSAMFRQIRHYGVKFATGDQ